MKAAILTLSDRSSRGERAVASNAPLELDVPILDLNDATAVAGFIEERFLL